MRATSAYSRKPKSYNQHGELSIPILSFKKRTQNGKRYCYSFTGVDGKTYKWCTSDIRHFDKHPFFEASVEVIGKMGEIYIIKSLYFIRWVTEDGTPKSPES